MKAPFAIDPQTGHIRFPDLSLELRPLMPQAEFITATSSLNRDHLGANDGWQRYLIRALISADRKLGLFVIFVNDRLKILSFAYGHKDDSWANWTEEGECRRSKGYRDELAAQLGPGNIFPWGKARVQLDSKSGGTDIWMEFSDSVTEQSDCSRA